MSELFKTIYESIQQAEREAIKKGIEVNTIMLNDKFDFCKGFYRGIKLPSGDIAAYEYPPMILGKDVRLVDFLPDQYPFALTKTNINTSEYIKSLENKLALLKKYIKVIGHEDSEQFVFKGVSSRRNKEDFERIKELVNENRDNS